MTNAVVVDTMVVGWLLSDRPPLERLAEEPVPPPSSGVGSVCIDEDQHGPLVLDAIKAELNRDGTPGVVASGAWPCGTRGR